MRPRQTNSVRLRHSPKNLGFVPAHWWQALLHNQTAWLIKAALLYRRRETGLPRVVIDVPYYIRQ